jgi:hypothetical protein
MNLREIWWESVEWMHFAEDTDQWRVRLYPQGNSSCYLLDKRLGGPQSRSGRGGEEQISQPRQESKPRTPIVQPVAGSCENGNES